MRAVALVARVSNGFAKKVIDEINDGKLVGPKNGGGEGVQAWHRLKEHQLRGQFGLPRVEEGGVGPEGRSLYCLNLNCRALPVRFFRLDLSFR